MSRYHPHFHGATALQVGGGAAGALIVEDEDAGASLLTDLAWSRAELEVTHTPCPTGLLHVTLVDPCGPCAVLNTSTILDLPPEIKAYPEKVIVLQHIYARASDDLSGPGKGFKRP